MRIKLIVAGAAIALVAGIGSASAAEQFSTLKGITAEALTPQEMGVMKGESTGIHAITHDSTLSDLSAAVTGLLNNFVSGDNHVGAAHILLP